MNTVQQSVRLVIATSMMTMLLVSGQASAFCVGSPFIHDDFEEIGAGIEIPVYIWHETVDPLSIQNNLTRQGVTTGTLGELGIDKSLAASERAVKLAIHEINQSGADFQYYYGGILTNELMDSPSYVTGVILQSANRNAYEHCCSGATAITLAPSPRGTFIIFRPFPDQTWTMSSSYTASNLDFVSVLTHELLHAVGLFHSGSTACTATGATGDGSFATMSIMNTSRISTSTVFSRNLFRDDIEGLRLYWGGRDTDIEGFVATNPTTAAGWTSSGTVVTASTTVDTNVDVTTLDLDGSTTNQFMTYANLAGAVRVRFRSAGAAWGAATVLSGPVAKNEPSISFGKSKGLIVFSDETNKSAPVEVKAAFFSSASGMPSTFSVTPLTYFGFPFTVDIPAVEVGYDPASERFAITYLDDSGSPDIAVLGTSNSAAIGTSGISDVVTDSVAHVGKLACDSSGCLIPYTKINSAGEPELYFARGSISLGGTWTTTSTHSGGWLNYTKPVIAAESSGFAVSFRTSTRATLGSKTLTAAVPSASLFYITADFRLPAGIGSVTNGVPTFTAVHPDL